MKKRMFSMMLSVLMAFSCVSMNAAAADIPSAEDPSDVVNGYDISIIPSNVAEILALRFVEANADAGLAASWTEDTVASDVVPMFDENGTPTAFSVELSTNGVDTGYVVISAYPDVENYILEYADAADPLYEELNLAEDEEVVYTATLTYLKDDGSDVLVGVQGEQVARSNVENEFEDLRDAAVFEEKRDAITQILGQEPVAATMSAAGDDGTDAYGTIVDPLLYIEAVYGGGTYTATEWKNVLEPYTKYRIMNNFNSAYPNNCCGPTAITNLIETAGAYRNISTIKNKNAQTIFTTVENIGLNNGWFHSSGTYFSSMRNYMVTALSAFGVSVTSGNTYTNLTYNIMKQEIDANRFCILGVSGHEPYGNHFVYPYAYTRFQNTQNGYLKSFLKVADGWSGSGRYVDMGTVANKTDQWFYSVGF